MLYWIIAVSVPLAGLLYFVRSSNAKGRRPSSGKYDPKTGLGRGAPGFQTNVKRIAVPADIIARIRAGEEVSAEEITRAQEKMQREEAQKQAAEEAGADDGSVSPSKRKKKGSKR